MDELTEVFEETRGHLRAVAFRMLGRAAEAEDAVQEAWLRAAGADVNAVVNVPGWLTTIVSRVCLDLLRARTRRREEPADMAVMETVLPDRGRRPEDEAELIESVGLALLVVLDRLGPAERVAFVLHDLFAVPFAEIVDVVDRSPGRGEETGQPGAAAGARRARPAAGRSHAAAGDRGGVPGRLPGR
ncbi:RNA polymerase sigma factor (sigma-70 family) [Herbihabitans rhizosphaerae]|uniref:RNA polymerase sigma factor (Sigma-70 family) n=1 Tax=Herbihabitans rhizosphaerae TaxID=1872711 RepID=A0A4Q7KEM5_9PSEU|nr:RNA polymerase sigma factor (sigma-70 family) [Herbihabitans rhizosphaerae]